MSLIKKNTHTTHTKCMNPQINRKQLEESHTKLCTVVVLGGDRGGTEKAWRKSKGVSLRKETFHSVLYMLLYEKYLQAHIPLLKIYTNKQIFRSTILKKKCTLNKTYRNH